MPSCNQKHERKKSEIAFIDESKVEANTNQGVYSDVKPTFWVKGHFHCSEGLWTSRTQMLLPANYWKN